MVQRPKTSSEEKPCHLHSFSTAVVTNTTNLMAENDIHLSSHGCVGQKSGGSVIQLGRLLSHNAETLDS